MLATFVLACALQAGGLAAAEGKVVDDISGLPVEHARVVLVRESAGYRPSDYDTQPTAGDPDPKADRLAVLTSDDGRFRFRLEGPVK